MAKSMRKLFAVTAAAVLMVVMVFGLAACDTTEDPVTYTVTFYDGSTVITTQTVEEGGTATEITPSDVNYSKEGYTFNGWYATSDYTHDWSFSTVITANTNVYSQWLSATLDTRQWLIAGSSSAGGPLASIGWNSGALTGDVTNVLTQTEGKNEFTITIDLYSGDEFQFCVQDASGNWNTDDSNGGGARGGQYLTSNSYMASASGGLGDGQSNIVVSTDGNYTLVLTTDADDSAAGAIDVTRNGEAAEIVVSDEEVISYYLKGKNITGWKDMYNDSTIMSESNGVYTLSAYIEKDDEIMFASYVTKGTEVTYGTTYYIFGSNIADTDTTSTQYVSGTSNMTTLVSGTYTFTFDSSTKVLTVACDTTTVLDSYDYYIDGTIAASNISWTGITSLKLAETTSGSGIYALSNVELTAGDEIIVRAMVAGATDVGGENWTNSKATYGYTYLSGGGSNFSAVSGSNSNISVLTSGTYNVFFDSYSKIITISSGYDVYLSSYMNNWNANFSDKLTQSADDSNIYELTYAFAASDYFGFMIYNEGTTDGGTWVGVAAMGTTGDANSIFTPESGNNWVCSVAGVYKIVCSYDGTSCTVDIYNSTFDIYLKGSMQTDWDHGFSSTYKLTATTDDSTVFEITYTFEKDCQLGLALYESGATTGYGTWIGLSNLGTSGDANDIFKVDSGNLTCSTAGTYKISYNAVTGVIDFYTVSGS